ncbi:MAG: four-carbon acid sugar kinase family protein [Azospirillaceae bacterium]
MTPSDSGPVLLGAIADDFTGATDLCNTLVRGGMPTVQVIGVPPADRPPPDGARAVVVALKSRTIPAAEAVEQSLAAARWLRAAGARRLFFKYCSTFDSTPAGNIGPVADALLDLLDSEMTVACPAFPETGRTIYQGRLFVGGVPLDETHMARHPLTPMTDADLVRLLAAQTPGRVGLVAYPAVARGAGAIAGALAERRSEGCRHVVLDVLEDDHLRAIAAATADMPLLTGGSGLALGLPDTFRRAGLLAEAEATALPTVDGYEAVISGSCSAATLEQTDRFAAHATAFRLDPAAAVADAEGAARTLLDAALPRLAEGPVLIHAGAAADAVAEAQRALGRERAGAAIEAVLARVARGLVEAGVRRLVVAGGETAGAIVGALGVKALAIGEQIDPGVPATVALDPPRLALALKSGNFGGPDFFAKALAAMPGTRRAPAP